MSKIITKIVDQCRTNRDESGTASIGNVDVAKLIRVRLRNEFPGINFRVRCSRGDAVNISWTDGPLSIAGVDRIAREYCFGGFDGSIDMAYSSSNWLHTDGTMSAASCRGTEGSLGTVASLATDCPQPGSVLVEYGPKYVFTHRSVSADRRMELIRLVEQRYDFTFDDSLSTDSQRVDGAGGEYLYSVCRDLERELAETLTGNLPAVELATASSWCNWANWA